MTKKNNPRETGKRDEEKRAQGGEREKE